MNGADVSRIWAFIEAVKRGYSRTAASDKAVEAEIGRIIDLLNQVFPQVEGFPESGHPVVQHARAALDGGNYETAELIAAIRPIIKYLPWKYHYSERSDNPGLADKMAFAEIIGPEAPLRSRQVCLGLTLIGPDTFYPDHYHPAAELYYVLSGTAAWSLDGSRPQENPPDSFILHPSNAVHSMRTKREPLLALYTWSGDDVITSSVYTGK